MSDSFSDADREAISDVREQVGQLLKDVPEFDTDFDILRWLQNYSYDTASMLPHLRSYLKLSKCWHRYEREQSYKPHPIISANWPCGLLDLTGKDNSFLEIDTIGRMDITGLEKSLCFTKQLFARISDFENLWLPKLREQERKSGKQSGVFIIQDLEGLQLDKNAVMNAVMGPYKSYCTFFSYNYGGMLRKFVVVNAPSWISYIWHALSAVLPQQIREKVLFLGTDWRDELLDLVDPDSLPVHWGGRMVDENGDEMCRSRVVVPAEKIPETLYWKAPDDDEDDWLEELVVGPGRFGWITVEVQTENSTLYWYYKTDMGCTFAVYHAQSDEGEDAERMDMVYPLIPLCTTVIPEEENFRCVQPGFYKLRFGNEAAWWYNLTVKYKVKVN